MMQPSKMNSLGLGVITGIILFLLVFFLSWLFVSDLPFGEYITRFYKINKLPSLMSLSAIPNLLLFFGYIWTNRYKSARGVILATFFLAFIMLIIKIT